MEEKIRDLNLKKNRNRIKKIKDHFGGKCSLCGYNKNYSALHFHHLRDKKFAINQTMARFRSFSALLEEAEKCILVCANCHAEIHHPDVSIKKDTTKQKVEEFLRSKLGKREIDLFPVSEYYPGHN